MPSFQDTIAGMPVLKDMTASSRDGLAERVVMDVIGRHRWPFLLEIQKEFTWDSSTAIMSFDRISRIESIMFQNTSGNWYRLEELSNTEFQRHIEMFPSERLVRWWRDGGFDGDKLNIEVWAVPSASATIKVDFVPYPNTGDIDDLPARFQLLVMKGMQSHVGTLSTLDYEFEMQRTIAREMDLQGTRDRFGKDAIQSSRMQNVNDPS